MLWRSSCCHCHCVAVANARGVQGREGLGEAGEWSQRRRDDHDSTIITSSLSPRCCWESVGEGGERTSPRVSAKAGRHMDVCGKDEGGLCMCTSGEAAR
jgi:hypothetical protein